MYWTFAQQLAHMTVNGATTRAGDLFASGTVSGPTPSERGSLIEQIADGTADAYLADGDTVTLRGWCGGAGTGIRGSASARRAVPSSPTPTRGADDAALPTRRATFPASGTRCTATTAASRSRS